VAADEHGLLHTVLMAVLEQLSGAAQVDAVAFFGVGREVGDRRHVNQRVGSRDAEHVFGRALANVDLMHLHAFRDVGPWATIDADHFVSATNEPVRNAAGQRAADAGDQDLHGVLSFSGPGMRSNMNERGRASSPVLISRSIA